MFTTNFSNIDINEICRYNSHCQLYDNQIINGKKLTKGGTRKKRIKKRRKTRKR